MIAISFSSKEAFLVKSGYCVLFFFVPIKLTSKNMFNDQYYYTTIIPLCLIIGIILLFFSNSWLAQGLSIQGRC